MATILIVDDRLTNREYLVTLLGYAGHRLFEAAEGEAALAVARAERPDLIIADIVMPTMDGYELARQVRADPDIADTQIIFFTSSYVVAETRRLAEACGVEHIIAKPAEPQVILEAVAAALKTRPHLPPQPVPEEFHREHMRLLTDALANRVEALEAEIVERQQAQAALAASEKRFRALIENSTDAISLLGADGRLLYVSPSTERMLGYAVADVVGTDPAALTHPDDLPGVLALLGDLRQHPGQTRGAQYRIRHKDGAWRWIEASITNLLAEPSVGALVFNYRDVTERVQAEEKQRLQSAALNAAANVIVITDPTGAIQSVNPAFTQLTGYAPEAVLGQNPRVLNSGQQDRAFYEHMWATISAGQVWQGEMVNRRQDGSFYTQDQTITPVRDAAGRITHYIAIGQDITARKRDEERIRYLATVIENLSNGVVSTDNDMNIQSWNVGAETMFGYSAAEVVGRPYGQVLAYDYLDSSEGDAIRQVAETGRWKGEVRVQHKDGTPIYALVAGAVVKDSQGQPTGFSAVLHDITERKQAEEAVRQSEARFRSYFELGLVGLAVTSPDKGFLEVNDEFCAILGYPRSELLHVAWSQLTFPDDLEQDQKSFAHVLAGEIDGYTLDKRWIRKDGRVIHTLISVKCVRRLDGSVDNFVGLLLDITNRKQAEEAVRQAQAKYRTLVEQMPAITYMAALDDSNATLYISPQIEQFGYAPDEYLSDPDLWSRNIHPQDRERVIAEFARSRADRAPLHCEYRLLDRSGRVIWLQDDAVIVYDDNGQPLFHQGVVLDITERKLRQRELEAIAAASAALRSANNQAQMLPIILGQVRQVLETDTASVLLRDPASDELIIALGQGELTSQTGQHVPAGAGIAGRVLATGEPYVTHDITHDALSYKLSREVDEVRAAACVPLITRQHVLGVIWAERATTFTADEVRVLVAIADLAANAIQRAVLHELTEQQLKRLVALREIDNAIMNSLDLRLTLGILLRQATEQLNVSAAAVLLLNQATKMLEFAAQHGFRSPGIQQSRLRIGEGHAGRAALERRLVYVQDMLTDPQDFRRTGLLANEEFVAHVCAPLVAKGQVVGVLEVFHREPLAPDADWLSFVETLAGQAAIAVADAWLFADLQRSNLDMVLAYDTTLEGWSAALDLRDRETEGHSQRVTELTLRLAEAMGVSEAERIHIRRGSLLHDIGKMGIPDSILLKPGPLTDEEWVIMRKHPVFAYQLLSPIAYLRPALDIPYCHHEKWDGSGYPRGLSGEQIPLAARLFAIVDVWDALRSDRPYRQAWPVERVLAHIQKLSGSHFEPRVAEVFRQIISQSLSDRDDGSPSPATNA